MNKREAYELLFLIEQDAQSGPASIRVIGNGEHVIVLKARSYHIWSLVDYRNYLADKEQERAVRREAKGKELVAS